MTCSNGWCLARRGCHWVKMTVQVPFTNHMDKKVSFAPFVKAIELELMKKFESRLKRIGFTAVEFNES